MYFIFKNDSISFLSAIVIKLLERCPLKYFLVQSLVIVVPQKLIADSAEAQVKFEQLLQILLNGKWCSAEPCDKILTEFKGFVLEMKQNHLAEFLSFNMNTDRSDKFYWNYMKMQTCEKFLELSLCFHMVKLQLRESFQSTNFWLKTCKRKP